MTLWPVLALAYNASAWGLSWWPFRHLQAWGLHPLWATFLIYGVSVLAIAAWRPSAWRQVRGTPALWLVARPETDRGGAPAPRAPAGGWPFDRAGLPRAPSASAQPGK